MHNFASARLSLAVIVAALAGSGCGGAQGAWAEVRSPARVSPTAFAETRSVLADSGDSAGAPVSEADEQAYPPSPSAGGGSRAPEPTAWDAAPTTGGEDASAAARLRRAIEAEGGQADEARERYAQATPRAEDTTEGTAPTATDATSGPLLIYSAQLGVSVHHVRERQDEVIAIADELGGFLASRTDDTVVVRVPAVQFDSALGRMRELGTLVTQRVDVQDVSEEFRDVQLRIRTLEAMRARVEQLLEDARRCRTRAGGGAAPRADHRRARDAAGARALALRSRRVLDHHGAVRRTDRRARTTVSAPVSMAALARSPNADGARELMRLHSTNRKETAMLRDARPWNLQVVVLALALAATTTGCGAGFAMELPERFVVLELDRSAQSNGYVQRGTTPDGVVIGLRALDHRVRGTREFWSEAVVRQLRDRSGYELIDESEIEAANGQTGTLLRLGRDLDGHSYRYTVAVFVTDSHIWIADAGGRQSVYDPMSEQIEGAIGNLVF